MEATDLYLNLFPARNPWREPEPDRELSESEKATIRKSNASYRTLSRRFKVPQSRIASLKRATGGARGRKAISCEVRRRRNKAILERFKAGDSRVEIAREMGLSRDMVYRICAEGEG